jgi:tetratricopeptide (TPR) repeat protein
MQPYAAGLAGVTLTPQREAIKVGDCRYRAAVDANDPNAGCVLETGPQGAKAYPIEQVMGGKDVVYLLTTLAKGRLQVLPMAYDVRKRQWYNTTESMVRHFAEFRDTALDWRDPGLTFNTACYSCHVSQLSPNYDPNTDTFHTTWQEPGINCQTCHGSAEEHVAVCSQAKPGPAPADLKIVTINRRRGFSGSRIDSACAPCHAKNMPVTGRLGIGEDYFDHYGLATFEDPDFYPDGRDLGENFTYTQWRMNPCAASGRLDCLHCHSSSGRYRLPDPNQPNSVCLPCHQQQVANVAEHTHHKPDLHASHCISCHMPTTEFARMRRTDHSMRPPMPAASIAFGSPNACTLCHDKKDAAWADQQVRAWHKKDFQAPVLHAAGLIAAARRQDWSGLDAMLAYLQDKGRGEVFANSLVRLLAGCPDDRKWPVLADRLQHDPSPLIRGSAAGSLAARGSAQDIACLTEATRDPVRLVRVQAAAALAPLSAADLPAQRRQDVQRATDEYRQGLLARGYQWDSPYNLGAFAMERQQYSEAVRYFQWALQLRPDNPPVLVNLATCYNQLGRNSDAEKALTAALRLDPNSAPAHLNLGLLLGELARFSQAAAEFQAVLRLDPNSPVAAYNLAEILKSDQPAEALVWYRKALQARPESGKYASAYAVCLAQQGQVDQAVRVLQGLVDRSTDYSPVYLLLGEIHRSQGRPDAAIAVFSKALANEHLPQQDRDVFLEQIRSLQD